MWAVYSIMLLLVVLVFVLTLALIDIAQGYRKLMADQHSYCVSAISEFCSDRLIAQWLREHAEKWDGVDMRPLLLRLGREQYQPGGPSVPAIWMRYEADRIDPRPETDTVAEYNLAGERII